MKKQIAPSVKAHLIRGTFYLLLLLGVGGIPLALSQRQPREQRTLTFAERVAYQRAIEEVYWHHRIWPKERPDLKPSLDAVISQAQLEEKVADYLRKSRALEDYWQRPITAEQLQAEMDRMVKHTKQPEVLRELFEELGNDPFLIAECLARPALAERLLRNWYADDHRIHGGLRNRAEGDLKAHPTVEQMKRTSGKYTQIELVKSDRASEEVNRGTGHSVQVNSRKWDETVQKLAVTFNNASDAIDFGVRRRVTASRSADNSLYSNNAGAKTYNAVPVGVVSPLQEDKESYYATAVIERTNDRLKLGTVAWLKEPLESWLAKAEHQTPNITPVVAANYTLPKVSDADDGCIEDTWAAIVVNVPSGRWGHTAVWTGSEMIVWGGSGHEQGVAGVNTGWRYNPPTDTWTATTTVSAPSPRRQHTAVWTGNEMIVWGGTDGTALYTGGRYDPNIDNWTPTSVANAPAGRGYHTAVWTGNEMIIWGGSGQGTELNTGWKYNSGVTSPPTPTPTPVPYLNTGARYNPNTDSWTSMSIGNTPEIRAFHTAVWTGHEMTVWGGAGQSGDLNTGGKYNPNTDNWTTTSTTNAPTGRDSHTGVWTGNEMIVWGGSDRFGNGLNTGGRYNPDLDSWTTTSTVSAPTGRYDHTSIWTGNEVIIWGGAAYPSLFNSGGRYDPGTDSWVEMSTSSAPSSRELHTAVWTGSEMIVWGGNNGDLTNTGGRYNPNLDNWVATADATQERFGHTAVWTGNEMIVWGGGFIGFNTGGRYNPGTDEWADTSTVNAPTGRYNHTAVWTGSEMIVWGGGGNFAGFLNTGGRYNPSADSWIATSTLNAPSARDEHTAVWTGSEMIIWGGVDWLSNYLNTGGRYDPELDGWTATTTIDSPERRRRHTAVWAGSRMIVWGGDFVDNNGYHFLNTGGRYDPDSDSWVATSTSNAPEGRESQTVVWTGGEMIVWGGYFDIPANRIFLNTGGRYNPSTDGWTATSITNAPSARAEHTAVWTGSELIVWGGYFEDNGFQYLNTGGRYNPSTDGWIATSITNVPSARVAHSAVWTGSEMIVWGGFSNPEGPLNTGGTYCAQSGLTPTPTVTPTPTETCVVEFAGGCGSIFFTPPTDFYVRASCPVDFCEAGGFTVNNVPADSCTVSDLVEITFHFNTSPVVPDLNTMHIQAAAYSCCGRSVAEFTCTFHYEGPRPSTPSPRPRPSPHPRP